VHKSTFKGAEGLEPPGPELVHIKAGDPNHAAKFDFSLQAPNEWSGVALEIQGRADADGRPQADDVSGYKFLTLQVYATAIRILRLEIRTNESGKDTRSVYPLYQFEVKPGLNTYRTPLDKFTQPGWADMRFFSVATDFALDMGSLEASLPEARCRPVWRRFDARTLTWAEYLVEVQFGAGRIWATTLRFSGGLGRQPAGFGTNSWGAWLLARLLDA
jgi:hypothetical protein